MSAKEIQKFYDWVNETVSSAYKQMLNDMEG